MALTVEQLGRTNVSGNRHTVALKITFDSSYPTGGEALDLTAYVANIEGVSVEESGGYVFQYDRSNKKLKAYNVAASDQTPTADITAAALAEVTAATNLSSVVTYLTVTGGRA